MLSRGSISSQPSFSPSSSIPFSSSPQPSVDVGEGEALWLAKSEIEFTRSGGGIRVSKAVKAEIGNDKIKLHE